MKILIVDDEKTITTLLTMTLSAVGYATTCAGNGKEGLERLAEEDIDLIISDICMPEMDGLQLLQMVRQQYPDIGVIIITGNPGHYLPEDIIRAGAIGLVGKPFKLKDLLAIITLSLQEKEKNTMRQGHPT